MTKDDPLNYPEYIEKQFVFNITHGVKPERLDIFLSRQVMNATRTKVQYAIENGNVLINGRPAKASRKIQPGDLVECTLMKPPPIELIPENIPIEVLYEDEHLLVVNKPAGMVTHPGFGNRYGTLVNAMLWYLGGREPVSMEISDEEEPEEGIVFSSEGIRPGIVHRLDKDTSGLLLIAKNPVILAKLQSQFADRSISRQYYALVWGIVKNDSGTIDADIGRSPRNRKLFAVVTKGGKKSVTDYEVIERYSIATLIKARLKTGRTHQIRVHFSHLKHPLLGDESYGGNKIVFGGGNPDDTKLAQRCLKTATRQMLHAKKLTFRHPVFNELVTVDSNLPIDLSSLIELLRNQNS